MPFTGIEADESFRPGSGGAGHLDEGYYLFEVLGFKASPQDYANKPYWEANLRIVEGASGVGMPWNPRLTWAPRAQFRLAGVLAALGMDVSKLSGLKIGEHEYKKFAALAEQFGAKHKGRKIGAYVADGNPDDRGRARSEMQDVFTEDEYRKRASVLSSAPPASARKASPNGTTSARKPQASDDDLAGVVDEFFASEDVVV